MVLPFFKEIAIFRRVNYYKSDRYGEISGDIVANKMQVVPGRAGVEVSKKVQWPSEINGL